MGLIPDEVIAEIRDRADIVAVIGQHVQLRKAGRNHKGLCPFHHEKSPSFNVNPDKGFFYCFGCQKKGDVFSFVMEYEGKSFLEAAESLAGMTGIVLPRTEDNPAAIRQRSERADMIRINELAADFFHQRLDEAMPYLAKRGIDRATADRFKLGWAPSEWRALGDSLAAGGVSAELAEKVGLIVKQPRAGGFYDRFRERIVCPVVSASNAVVGFSARRVNETEEAGAKYINSPESSVYKKSKLLYGVHLARDAFRKTGRAVLVEGNFDVISLHQAGIEEAVAPLGTALTAEQALQLLRLAGKVVLLYDGDNAGRAATLRSVQTLLAADVEVLIAELPLGEDPDSLIRSAGGEAMKARLDDARPAVEYFINAVWTRGSADGRAEWVKEAAEVLRSISNETKRDFLVGAFAGALRVEEQTLRKALRRALQGQSPEIPSKPQREVATARPPRYELDLVALIHEHPQLLSTAEKLDVVSLLTDSRLRDMYSAAREGRSVLSSIDDQEITAHLLSGSFSKVPNPVDTLESIVAQIKKVRARERLVKDKPIDVQREDLRAIFTTRKQVD